MAERAVTDENKVLSDVSEDEISLELSRFDHLVLMMMLKLNIVMLQHRSNLSLTPVAQIWSLTGKQISMTVPLDFKILIDNNVYT